MRQYETKTVTKTYEEKSLVKLSCDLCGREACDPLHDDPWGRSSYDIDNVKMEVVVRHEEGSSYPGGGSKTTTEIDICPTCFKDKLLPWLVSQGANPKITESDW